ncbi:MAG: glycosyltransferase family 9 protein [Candidatus Nealsonbacteria bacterium]
MGLKRIQAYFNNFFWLFLTYAAAPYLYLKIRLSRKKERQKILIIQRAKIGDLVCTTHVFREIKKKFPGSYLSAMVIARSKGILKNNPHLDEVISLGDFTGMTGKIKLIKKLRKDKYDWIFTVLPDPFINTIGLWSLIPHRAATIYRGAGEIIGLTSIFNNYHLEYLRHTSVARHYLNLLKFIGIDNGSEEKEIFIRSAEKEIAMGFLKKHGLSGGDLLVGISVTSEVEFRQWELQKFAKLADLLAEELKAKVIFIGANKDFAKNEQVRKMMTHNSLNTAGVFTLEELPAFLANLKLFISMDTGPIYIANALGVPVVDIVGADDMREQSPFGLKVRIIQKKLYCAPCIFVFAGIRYCKEGHLRCLKEITAEDVFQAAKELLL